MNWSWRISFGITCVGLMAVGIVVGTILTRPATGQEGGVGLPRYSVVASEGVNMIVTDNIKHQLYFYTVDQGQEPGAELKLRGIIDLTQVGTRTIKPKTFFKGNQQDGD